VSASEFTAKQVEWSGCSGEALLLALEEEKMVVGQSAAKALMAEIGSLTSRFQRSVANSKSTLFEQGQLARVTGQNIAGGGPADQATVTELSTISVHKAMSVNSDSHEPLTGGKYVHRDRRCP